MENGYELRETSEKGEGIFAVRPFKAGETVLIGKPEEYFDRNDSHATQVGDNLYARFSGLLTKINHSCNPNCGVQVSATGEHVFVAMQEITADDEVTIDYAMRNYIMDCFPEHCGCEAENCRGQITGWKDLPEEQKKKYRGFGLNYLDQLDKKHKERNTNAQSEGKEDNYKIYSDIYDIFYHSHSDTEFIDDTWRDSWRKVLEVGVGTGRLIPYYLKKNLRKYVGLDISHNMIEQIDQDVLNEHYTCLCASIHEYKNKERFDLIHYSYNTFNYILSPEEACRELAVCREMLAEGGVLLLDMTFPGCITRGVSEEYQVREQVKDGDTIHLLKCKDAYDTCNKAETRHLKYLKTKGEETVKELNWVSKRRFYPLTDLLQVAEDAGLSAVYYTTYGDTQHFFGAYEGYFILLERKPF